MGMINRVPTTTLQELRNNHQLHVVRGRIWDSISYRPGQVINSHNARWFWDVGMQSGKRYPIDTNMQLACRLPAPEEFVIERALLVFSSASDPKDVQRLTEMATWNLWLGQKRYAEAPLISLPRLGDQTPRAPLKVCLSCRSVSIHFNCQQCGGTSWEFLSHGGTDMPDTADMDGIKFVYDFGKGGEIYLPAQMHFESKLAMDEVVTDLNGTGLKLWCFFEGWHAHGIQ